MAAFGCSLRCANSSGGASRIFSILAHDIRSQYTLAYKPHNQNAKPEFQSVRVEARAPGYGRLTVRTRSGYYGAETAR